MFDNNKNEVYRGVIGVTFPSNAIRNIVCSILYALSEKEHISNNKISYSAVSRLHAKNILGKVLSLKNKYVLYNKLIKYEDELNKNFLQYTLPEINKFLQIYLDNSLIEPFNISRVLLEMYSVLKMTSVDANYLLHVHFDVMVPICKFYMTNYSTLMNDLKILLAQSTNGLPGKNITFTIDGITPLKIMSDIKLKRIPLIDSYIYNIDYSDNAVLLTLK